VAIPENIDLRTATRSGVYKLDKIPSDGLLTALKETNAAAMQVCGDSAHPSNQSRSTEFYVFRGNLPPPGTQFVELKNSPLLAQWYSASGEEWHIRNPLADQHHQEQEQQAAAARQRQQQAERQAAAEQEKQRQEQARRDAAKACKSAASQLSRQETIQDPKSSIVPAARLTEAEAIRMIREARGLPALQSAHIGGIREIDPLYPEVFCLVAEGFVKPGSGGGMVSAVVAEKGKRILANLHWGQMVGGNVDFWPYTHRIDVTKIVSILSDSKSNTATVTYQLAAMPTEYYEKLKRLDPRFPEQVRRAHLGRDLTVSLPEPQRTMNFKKWDQGWLPQP
jgi:flagellar biosynthesis GTPase FlhF